MNEDETEDEQTSDRVIGANIRQAMSALEGDLAGTEATGTQQTQTDSELGQDESGPSHGEL